MTIEYHGWVALATSQTDWSDGEFGDAFRRVETTIRTLRAEDGHEPVMPDGVLLPRVVYFKGIGVESEQPALRVIEIIAKVLDRSYGELVVFKDDRAEPTRRMTARRFCLSDGTLTEVKCQQASAT